uniref:Uncharacterized protein n=1 Tax=Arundo donax TaxID=35708 RepID=A0A0A9GC04_ARUDO
MCMYLCMKYCHVSITNIAMINCNTITRAGGCFLMVPLSSPRTVKRRSETAIWKACWTRTPLTTVHFDTMFLVSSPLGWSR